MRERERAVAICGSRSDDSKTRAFRRRVLEAAEAGRPEVAVRD